MSDFYSGSILRSLQKDAAVQVWIINLLKGKQSHRTLSWSSRTADVTYCATNNKSHPCKQSSIFSPVCQILLISPVHCLALRWTRASSLAGQSAVYIQIGSIFHSRHSTCLNTELTCPGGVLLSSSVRGNNASVDTQYYQVEGTQCTVADLVNLQMTCRTFPPLTYRLVKE